jgi:ribosomal protein S18 acetylase RimI-like enzyme
MEGVSPTLSGATGSTVSIRPADPADAGRAGPLIYDSGPEIWDYVFCGHAPEAIPALARLFADGRGPFGWRTCTVGETDGRVVGTVIFYPQTEERRLNREMGPQFLWLRGIPHRLRAIRRGMQLSSVMPPLQPGQGLLCCLAVDPALRGQGLGTQLALQTERAAIDAGCETLVLDVSSENLGAQHLYERLGYGVSGRSEFSGPQSAGIPPHLRMEKRLDPTSA